ncbi:uncharacterized protein LOC110725394 [Chenopodium quinoa]|uniref:uncharacterized protein LOC110725394 n=1 Tax=Chenopodium quinoa TaxID=63459 RepID=UPI000B77AA3E|nr:uncharacterized protein LOC110725394 [Chenopodium quinoa]
MKQKKNWKDKKNCKGMRNVKLPGISAIATAAATIAENLPAATTPKKPGRPRAATAVAKKPAEKTGRTRAAVIGKAGQKGGQKRPAASAKGPAKKRKVIDQVPYDEPSEDEEQEEVPATSSAPAEKKILKKVEQKDSEDPAFDAEKEEDEESEEVEVVQEKKTTLKKPKAEEKRMVLYEREPIKKIVKRKTKFSVAKKKEEEEEKNEEEVGSSTRGGHVKFMHWVKKMSDTQKKLVHEIGLGPLLDIELPQLDKQFNHWVLDSFEVSSCSFELPKGEKIEIEVEDVRIVYGLPMGDIPIVEAKSDRASEDFGVFIKNWRSKWQGKTPSVNQIIAQYTSDKFKNQRPAEEDFLTNFLLPCDMEKEWRKRILQWTTAISDVMGFGAVVLL